MIGLILIAASWAAEPGSWYIETPAFPTRVAAMELQREATEMGLQARVVRRYEHGVGWEFIVVVEGFPSEEAAQGAAARLAGVAGRGLTVYREGSTTVQDVATPSAVEAGDLPPAKEVLARAVRACGGATGGIARVSSATNLRFRFERTARDGDVEAAARMVYLRSGELQRLEVEPMSANSVASTTVVTKEGAWLTSAGEVVPREKERSEEVLQAYSPEEVLAWPLSFAALVATEPTYERMQTVQLLEVSGRAYYRLEADGMEPGDRVVLVVDAATWRPASIAFTNEAGGFRYEFDDWREVDNGVVVPFRVRLYRDGVLLDDVRVLELSLEPTLGPEHFAAPASPSP